MRDSTDERYRTPVVRRVQLRADEEDRGMKRRIARRNDRLETLSPEELARATGGVIGIISPASTDNIDVDGSGRYASGMMSPDGLAGTSGGTR